MATGLGFPAISTPNALDLRSVQTAISNARQRIEKLEALIATLQSSTNTGGTPTSVSLSALKAQLAALTKRVVTIENWFLGDDPGIVVWLGSSLGTRVLEAGDNITITNPNGQLGNPVISSEGGGGDNVLYDNTGRAMLTWAGQAILVS